MILKFKNERYQFDGISTVKSLKYKIFDKLNIRPEAQRLICQGYPLVDEQVIHEDSVIYLILQLC